MEVTLMRFLRMKSIQLLDAILNSQVLKAKLGEY
jgi:hypothetical protein